MARRRFALPLLFLSPLLLSPAAADYNLGVSTRTILGSAHAKKHPMRQVQKNIHRALKQTRPNPRVHEPAAPAMPVQAPAMPAPPVQTPIPATTESDRFLNIVAKIMT